ncbi:hypothetical protein RCL1_008821 [Eukaryota sp. TZLM3-RCL]
MTSASQREHFFLCKCPCRTSSFFLFFKASPFRRSICFCKYPFRTTGLSLVSPYFCSSRNSFIYSPIFTPSITPTQEVCLTRHVSSFESFSHVYVVSTFDEFLDKIRAVLSNARSRRVNIGLQKCTFTTCNHPIKILVHVFFKKTRSIDSSRISALVELPPPKNVKEVRSFVGSVNYLRDWLPQISEELAPIIELTRGSESGNRAPPPPIKWTHDHQLRFERIKRMIIDHVPLSLPDKDSKILISTDASDLVVGGMIWQEMPPCAPAGTPLIDRKVTHLSFFQQDPPKLTKELEHHTERTVRDHFDPHRVYSVRLPPKPKAHDLYGPQEHRLLVSRSGKEPHCEAMDPHPGRIFN